MPWMSKKSFANMATYNTILENTMMQLSRKLVNQNEMLIESLC